MIDVNKKFEATYKNIEVFSKKDMLDFGRIIKLKCYLEMAKKANIFRKAKMRKIFFGEAFASKSIILWQSKKNECHWISLDYGIRRSKKNQYFPIWINIGFSHKSFQLGFLKYFISIEIQR